MNLRNAGVYDRKFNQDCMENSIFFSVHASGLIMFKSVAMDSQARTNAVAKYVVEEAHTYDLTCRSREADESGC